MRYSPPHRNQAGFTLIELLVTMVIAGIVTAGMFNLYLNFTGSAQRQEEVLVMQQNARLAVDDLTRDLRQAGVDIQKNDPAIPDQASFAFAAPYEIIFNANMDDSLAGIRPAVVGDQVPTHPVVGATPYYDPAIAYARAETVRWSLDADNNGILNANDRMNTDNPSLYKLSRQIYGYNAATGNNGPLTATGSERVRGPDIYPNGSRPPVLFEYWINELDINGDNILDANEDVNGNGVLDMFLWGDDGGTLGVGNAIAGNGVIDPQEVTALMTGNNGGPKVLDSFQAMITSATGDARATAMTRSQALGQVKRITINVVTETANPDASYKSSPHGATYPYREQVISSVVAPRNRVTDVPSNLSLSISATPDRVQCPATSSSLTVRIIDAAGNLFTSPVDVTMTTSLGWFSPSDQPSATVTASSGVATFSLVGDPASTVTTAVISATAIVLAEPYAATTTVEFVPNNPSSVVVTPQVPSLPADGLSSTQVTAALLDSCGKPVGDGGTINWNITTNPLGIGGGVTPIQSIIAGSLATTTLKSGVSKGVAIISATETSTGITGIGTVNLALCSLQLTPAQPAIPADGTSTTQISFLLTNLTGAPQPGVAVHFKTDGGSVPISPVTTDGTGRGQITLTSGTTPHTALITATVADGPNVCALALGTTQVEFSDCGVTLASNVTEVVPGNPGGNATLTATVTDSVTGTPLSGQTLTFQHIGTDGTMTPATAVTNTAGQGSSVFTAGPTPGIADISVSTGCGVANASLFVRDCVVSVQALPQTIPPGAGNSTVITATLTDSISGSPLAGRSVIFAVDSPFLANIPSPIATTDVNGNASVTLYALGSAGIVTVSAISNCGASSTQVVLNDWQISLTSDLNTIKQGNSAILTATVTNGTVTMDPPAGDDLVTLSFDANPLGATVTPGALNTTGGITQHSFTAGTISGSVTVRASVTIGGVLLSATTVITITDPPGGDTLILDVTSPNVCGGKKVAFRVTNTGLDEIILTGMQISWNGGNKLKKVKRGGQITDCKGGREIWTDKGCGAPKGKQTSPATLTQFCRDTTVTPGNTIEFNKLNFDANMSGRNVTVVFTHEPVAGGTASTSTVTFTVP